MGTTKLGRIMNTKGSGREVSEYAIVHMNEGGFAKRNEKINNKKIEILRLKSGGHGQDGIKLLDKYHIEYEIEKVYSNGVRVGNVKHHRSKLKRRSMMQSWFPAEWTTDDMKHAAEHVAGLKINRHVPDGVKMAGMYKGVRVIVMKTHGKISTAFPDSKQIEKKGVNNE